MTAFVRAGIALASAILLTSCTAGESKRGTSAVAGSLPVWTLSTGSDEARKYVEEGERADDTGRPLEAYEQFKRAVAADSAFGYGYLRVANTGQSLDEYRANLQRAVAYSKTANETERLLIEIEQKQFEGDQQGALELGQRLTAMHPNSARAWLVLASLQSSAGQTADARGSAQKAVDLAPANGGTHLFLGNAYLAEPIDIAKAEQHILKGQELWPDEPLAYDLLGDVRRSQTRLDDAANAYSRQIELDPENAVGYLQRGHAYTFLGKYDQARADYDASIRLGKGNQPAVFSMYRALLPAYAGNPQASLEELGGIVGAIDGMGIPEPDGAKIGLLNAQILIARHSQNFDLVESALRQRNALMMKAVERVGTPSFRRGQEAGIAWADGATAAFKGDYAAARRKAAEVMRLRAPDRDPTKDRDAHALLGFAALFERKYDEAIGHFDQANPDDVYLWYHRGLALEGAGRAAEAKTLFRKVADFNFNQPTYAVVRKDAIARAN